MNDLRRSRGVGILSLAMTLLGCGSGGDPGVVNTPPPETCGMVAPCGGDLTGTWNVLGGCVDALFNGALTCPPNMHEIVGLDYAGTMTFKSDMTYTTTNLVERGAAGYTIPSSCLPGGVACADVNSTCTGAGPCTCSTSGLGSNLLGGSGSYSLFGNDVTFTLPNGVETGFSYCVQGGLLHLETYVLVIYSDGTRITEISSDIVAQMR